MRPIQGPVYECLEEQIVVIRSIPKNDQDPTCSGNHVFGPRKFDQRRYKIIINTSDNLKMAIVPTKATFDPSGIPISEADYEGYLIPPNEPTNAEMDNDIKQEDMVIRIEKDYQELWVYRVTDTNFGVQMFEFTDRKKVERTRY